VVAFFPSLPLYRASVITVTAISLLTTFGIAAFINNIQEFKTMRSVLAQQ